MKPIFVCIVLCAFIAKGSASESLLWDRECYVFAVSRGASWDHIVLTEQMNCTESGLEWHYAAGIVDLTMTWKDGTDFRLCLTEADPGFKVAYQNAEGELEEFPYPPYTPNTKEVSDYCRISRGGRMRLVFDAPPVIYYIAFVHWRIQPL